MAKLVQSLTKLELLNRASQFIFSTGLNDGTSELCRINMKYGLAQMHLIQEKYGFEPNAIFISTPDETISRNSFRWNSGFGYGGKIVWGTGKEKIIFLNTKPNQCGILVGGLNKIIDPLTIIKRINETKENEIYHNDILLDWDYGISNHFISLFKTKYLSDIEFPPYIFLIHGSAPELRGDKYGMGIYIDKSKNLKNVALKESTILGDQYILLNKEADRYLELNNKALDFSRDKREIIAKQLFKDEYKIICNQHHQFLNNLNTIYLGSSCTNIESRAVESNIFPIVLRSDLPAYLFEGKKNLSITTIKNQDFIERAEKFNVLDKLQNANILPHGAGYSFPDIKKVLDVIEYKNQRYFVLSCDHNIKKIIREPNNVQFEYRGRDIILKTLQLDLGGIIAKLNPIFSLKL
ncbi:MAG: hypothetical protein JXA99_03205 [Candidatus Lokiarchaeota archaeon]|nr:hypothetical protein [Candidatus Lokiarchaeota archaeon]